MSSVLDIEKPYIHLLEEKLSSKTLFVSNESKDALIPYYKNLDDIDWSLFTNPAPTKFSNIKRKNNSKIKNILIVSNHPPTEIIKARKILNKSGIKTVLMGEINGDEHKLIEPDFINKFDVVITIGKTVQYCMCAGIPVYIYDIFGGPGYLSDDNFILASDKNFSGRGFDQKEPAVIVNDIQFGYKKATAYHELNRNRFINNYSIDKVLPKIIKDIKIKNIESFSLEYINYLKATKGLVHLFIILYQNNEINFLKQKKINEDYQNLLIIKENEIKATKDEYNKFKNKKLIKITIKLENFIRKFYKR